MSERVQRASSARHSTTGDVYAMRAALVTPRWRVKLLQCGISTVSKEFQCVEIAYKWAYF